jgi:hypothetical protein
VTGPCLAGRHVRHDEAAHRHEGEAAAVDLDDAHATALVEMLMQPDEV